jgi:hypothetical protein
MTAYGSRVHALLSLEQAGIAPPAVGPRGDLYLRSC